MTHERCWLCSFWNGERCTNTFRLTIHITPIDGIGGQVDFQCTPGMVPEEIKPELTKYFTKLLEKVLPAISLMPVWDKIRDFQLANMPEKTLCPGREVSKEKERHLKVVKLPRE